MLPCSRCVQGSDGTGATAMAAFDMINPLATRRKSVNGPAHLTVIVMPRTLYQLGSDADQCTWLMTRGARSIRVVCHCLGTHLSAWQTPAALLSAPHKPMVKGTHKRVIRASGHHNACM